MERDVVFHDFIKDTEKIQVELVTAAATAHIETLERQLQKSTARIKDLELLQIQQEMQRAGGGVGVRVTGGAPEEEVAEGREEVEHSAAMPVIQAVDYVGMVEKCAGVTDPRPEQLHVHQLSTDTQYIEVSVDVMNDKS